MISGKYSPKKTQIAPKKWWLQNDVPLEMVHFLGDTSIFAGVGDCSLAYFSDQPWFLGPSLIWGNVGKEWCVIVGSKNSYGDSLDKISFYGSEKFSNNWGFYLD